MAENGNFLVYKSSAGSGKTFTLSRVFLGLALSSNDPSHFRKILAITFTVKAAAEMKERIIAYLSGFAGRPTTRKDVALMKSFVCEDLGLSPEQIESRSQAALISLIHNYGDLSILTIDKFVHRLVRSFSSDLNLTSDFEVEIEQQKLSESAVEALMERVGNDEAITKVILEFADHQVSDDKSWDVTGQLQSLANELNGEEFFLRSKSFEELNPQQVFEIQLWLSKQISKTESRCQELGNHALALVEQHDLDVKDFYQGKRGIMGFFGYASELDFDKLTSPNNYVLKTIEEDKWASGTKNPAVASVAPKLNAYYNELISLSDEIANCIFYKRLHPALFTMSLIGELRVLFAEIKAEENVQTLSDFYRLLSDRFSSEQTPFIYERLGNRYNHVLIDEFQDTSTLQWQNLLPLVENSLSEGKKSLIVGDAKQSIYRFRGSEPEQFVNLPKTGTSADLLFESSYSEHVLDTNFRSADVVIDFNNRFFDELKPALLSESLKAVYDDLHQKKTGKKAGQVHFHTVPKGEGTERIESFLSTMEQRIGHLISNENFQPEDICILFQRNADAAFCAGGLLELGYNVVSDESLLLVNNPETQLIISTLFAHRNADDPFFQQQWLSRLQQLGKLNTEYHSLAKWLKEHKASFGKLIRHLKLSLDIDLLNSGDAFSTTYYLCSFFELSMNDAFVRKLLDYALEFDQSSKYLKKSFLTKWTEDANKLSIESQGETNAIRVMTIHKSKGLEFPVVFVYLPELIARGTTRDYAWIPELKGIPGLRSAMVETGRLSKTPFDDIYTCEKERTHMDLMNTIYVAFTRASKHLEVFTLEKDGKPESKALQFIIDWPEWNTARSELVMND